MLSTMSQAMYSANSSSDNMGNTITSGPGKRCVAPMMGLT